MYRLQFNIFLVLVLSIQTIVAQAFTVNPPSLNLTLESGEMQTVNVSLKIDPFCIRAFEVDVVSSDAGVILENLSGVQQNGCGGDESFFDIKFTGTGATHNFDLQFIDAEFGGVIDSIPTSITPVLPLIIGLGTEAAGWLEAIETTSPYANKDWFTVSWNSYNNSVGESRPVQCDLDGDGKFELVIGLGSYPTNGGWIEIKDDATTGYSHLGWLRIDWATYNNADGQTWPACGDVDGDGRDEIIVGLGNDGQGWVKGFDDATTGYAALPGTPAANGWMRMNWVFYNSTVGAIHPAVGNLDGDVREEIVLGVGEGGGGWVEILDDAQANFTHITWSQLSWPDYNTANGSTWPTICDLDGNNQGEIAIGLGTYPVNGGWVQILDSSTNFEPLGCIGNNAWIQVPWSAYNSDNGATHPACLNMDSDSADELVLGLGIGGGGWIDIRDDCSNNVTHHSWGRLHWSTYNNANGLTWPASRR